MAEEEVKEAAVTTEEEVDTKTSTEGNSEDEGSHTSEKEAEQKESDSKEESEAKETSKEDDADGSDTIPTRPNASYIIERQRKTIERLRSKSDDDVEKGEEEEVESSDDVTSRLERIEQGLMSQADAQDLNEFFTREPDAKKYEKTIKAYMGHTVYKGVPPEVIYAYLDRKNVKSRTDSKRKAADLDAKQTRSAGSSARDTRSKDTRTAEDIRKMTPAEFKEYDREQQRLARS
jgi:hypothetical protein